MPDKNSIDNSRDKKDLSVDEIISDVMNRNKSSAPKNGTDKEHDVFLNEEDYLLDFDSDVSVVSKDVKIQNPYVKNTADTANLKNDSVKDMASMIAAAIAKKTEDEEYETETDDLNKRLEPAAAVALKSDKINAVNGSDDNTKDVKVNRKNLSQKRITSIAICYVLGVVFILLSVGISVFGYFTGLLQRTDSQNNGNWGLTLNSATYEDIERENQLRDQLAKAKQGFISSDNVTNILIIGEDIRDTADNTSGNTDVMMLCSINEETKEVTLTSFMRDMYVEIAQSGGVYAKLNSAYGAGGAELTMQTLKNNFGVDVDKYVLFNFYSFIDIVNACGGLDIRISDEEAIGMQAPMAEQNDCLKNKKGTDYLTKGGTYHMNGNQALAYARLRYVGAADFERTARQRRVVTKIAEKAKDMSLIELSDLLDKVLRQLKTNLTDGEIAYLLYNSADLLTYKINQLRIPADGMYTNETIRTQDVLVVDITQNIRLFQETVYGYTNMSDLTSEPDEDKTDQTDTSVDNAYDDYGEMNMFR